MKLHGELLARAVVLLSEAGHAEDIVGIDFKYNGPNSNSPNEQGLTMFTWDRDVIVHVHRDRRQVAYSQRLRR
jgi:hypothetical protein